MRVLTINTGSSSLKAALFEADGAHPVVLLTVAVERIGLPDANLRAADAGGMPLADERRDLADHPAAARRVLEWLAGAGFGDAPDAIGHRVVHGGRDLADPVLVTAGVLDRLRGLLPLAPGHMPQAIAAIAACQAAFPGTPQVACFDTAFHRSLPRTARLFALPRDLADAGVVRYGFHGLSCESIVGQLLALGALPPRLVIAHLGNGASMTAVRDGASVETTMGFTPAGGLVMGARPGDLDPGVVVWLLRERGLDADALDDLVNRRSGLRGLSGTSGDMRDLLAREASDPRAAEAIAVFCHRARMAIGALAAALGGLDALVFTGGIGEHAAPVRERICADLGFLGLTLDPRRNRDGAAVVSADGAAVVVRVMRTDEDREIARHAARLVQRREGTDVPL